MLRRLTGRTFHKVGAATLKDLSPPKWLEGQGIQQFQTSFQSFHKQTNKQLQTIIITINHATVIYCLNLLKNYVKPHTTPWPRVYCLLLVSFSVPLKLDQNKSCDLQDLSCHLFLWRKQYLQFHQAKSLPYWIQTTTVTTLIFYKGRTTCKTISLRPIS